MLTKNDINSISKIIVDSENRLKKELVTETKKLILESEKRIYSHIEQVRFDVKKYTEEGVDTVLEGMGEMFKEKDQEYNVRFEKIETAVFAV
jgi:hypothetical protein